MSYIRSWGHSTGRGVSADRRRLGAIFFIGLLAYGCEPKGPEFHAVIPFQGSPFDALADDVDSDGKTDLMLVSHGRDYARVFYQQQPRVFSKHMDVPDVGFHPGTLMRWPTGEPFYLVNAEGSNQLRSLVPKAEGGLALQNQLAEQAPVQSAVFHWPNWGEGLAVMPYESDEVILFRQFDRQTLRYAERIPVRLSKERPSLLEVGRILVLDANKDGMDELYFTTGIIGSVWKVSYPGEGKPLKNELVAKVEFGVPDSVLTADFNDDGYPDLLVPDKIPSGWLHVLLNDGLGGFKEVPFPNLLPGEELQQFAMARDKDGVNTLLIVGVQSISILRFPPKWAGGEGVELVGVDRAVPEASQTALLQDLDGDGWLDALAGLDRTEEGAWLVYGPVWDHFRELAAKKFVLQYQHKK